MTLSSAASWILKKVIFDHSTVWAVYSKNRTKFGKNQSNRSEVNQVFVNFKIVAGDHPGFRYFQNFWPFLQAAKQLRSEILPLVLGSRSLRVKSEQYFR